MRALQLIAALISTVSLALTAGSTTRTAASTAPTTEPPVHELVRVVLVGATGSLAAKYLWVASFRLALQAHIERAQQFEFVAAATNTRDAGRKWRDAFFDDAFLLRVCGSDDDADSASIAYASCVAFFHSHFLPNIEYAPLRDEAQYRQLAASLNRESATAVLVDSPRRIEVERLVYLAIPPAFFAQASEFAHRHLRPRSSRTSNTTSSSRTPFFRVIIEKPFGVDLQSAQSLQRQLRENLQSDEVFVVDHFAGKAAVLALRELFARNRVLLQPTWNAQHIREINVHMTEDETCATRMQYFHSTGIIRDVIANHLHLLLTLAVAPSLASEDNSDISTQHDRLAFTHSLTRDPTSNLLLGQYDDYATHYEQDIGRPLATATNTSPVFVPTAARVQLQSHLHNWLGTVFVLSAAKAVHERRLELRIQFDSNDSDSDSDSSSSSGCELRVTIQTQKNAHSERIEWTCRFLDAFEPPNGWTRLARPLRAIVPIDSDRMKTLWTLGDAPSAYDALLREAAEGNRDHFVSIDDAVAAWTLWSPIVALAEHAVVGDAPLAAALPVSAVVYTTGTTSWLPVSLANARDEL